MSAAEYSNALVASMVHSPRSVQRIVTAIGGTGFSIEDLQYHRCGDRQAFAVVALEKHLASRDLEHLSKIVDGTIDVLWAHPLAALASGQRALTNFRIDGYEVATCRLRGQTMTQARAAVLIDGRRHLGAADGVSGPEALARAVEAATRLAADGDGVTFHVAARWSNSACGMPAIVVADVRHARSRGSAIGVGGEELEATARAIEALKLPVFSGAPSEV